MPSTASRTDPIAADNVVPFERSARDWEERLDRARRMRDALRRKYERNPSEREWEMEACRRSPLGWVKRWVWTEDPRDLGGGLGRALPFVPWQRQRECFDFVRGAIEQKEERVVAKSRDQGYSWICVAIGVHYWLFAPGFVGSYGSRVETDVDQKGNPKSLFEKIRFLVGNLPGWMMPAGFREREHSIYMRLTNPQNAAVLVGEVGAQMGRGGRSSAAFVDEAAFIEQDGSVDRAISANADARIWGSTANGRGNVFSEKVFSGRYPVFRLHFRDDPRKGPEWERRKRAELLPHTFASEFDIDFAASVEGLLIEGPWIQAARRLHPLLAKLNRGWSVKRAGLDIGAGKAESVLCPRDGPLVYQLEAWTRPDSIDTAHKAVDRCRALGIGEMNYDSVGVGAGVTSALSRIEAPPEVHGINTGIPAQKTVRMPDGRTADETFENLRAQLWWGLRERFKRTYEFVVEGTDHPLADLIGIPADEKLESQLNLPTWYKTLRGKIAVVPKEKMKGPSPDRADALALSELDPPAGASVVAIRYT